MGSATIFQQIWAFARGNRMTFTEAAREFSRRRHGRSGKKKPAEVRGLKSRSIEAERRAFEELEKRRLA